jgi:DNA-directed RNA polymerase specialized sigma24 family protein
VAEPFAPSLDRARKELEKAGVRTRLVQFASWQTASVQDAEDLVHSALARVFDPQGSPWDPDGSKSFLMHVGSVMNGLSANEGRSWRAKHEVVDSNLARDERSTDGAPLADELLGSHQELAELRRLGERLLAELEEKDPDAVKVLRLGIAGIESAHELADKILRTVEFVYDANDRIRYHAARILEEERAAEAQRMRERRERGEEAAR